MTVKFLMIKHVMVFPVEYTFHFWRSEYTRIICSRHRRGYLLPQVFTELKASWEGKMLWPGLTKVIVIRDEGTTQNVLLYSKVS